MDKLQMDTNSNKHEQINKRTYDRNVPTHMLQPYLDVRPIMTKYAHLPIVDSRKQTDVQLIQRPTYNVHTNFNPGTSAPWSGFASKINVESDLRNQIYALQKCSQAVYVPNSTSDLYTYNFQTKQTPNAQQQHELLFSNSQFSSFNPNPDSSKIGTDMFMNPTRVQIRDLTKHSN